MPCLNLICKKFVKKIGAHNKIIAVVAGTMKAIIGRATIGIPNPSVPFIRPPAKTANIIITTIVGSLYIVYFLKLCHFVIHVYHYN